MKNVNLVSKKIEVYDFEGTEYVIAIKKDDITVFTSNTIPCITLITKGDNHEIVGKIVTNDNIPDFYCID